MTWKWTNGLCSFGLKYRGRIGHGGKRRLPNPISKIDDYVKHVFQEHNEEGDLLANIGAVVGGDRLLGWQLQRQWALAAEVAGVLRAHGDPRSGVQQMLVCSDYRCIDNILDKQCGNL